MPLVLNFCLLLITLSLSPKKESILVKCMIEMKDYNGEGAYINISIVNNENYLKTIYVLGNDKAWFSEMKSFWKYIRINKLYLDEDFYPLIDGITGATISGSQKRVIVLTLPKLLINKNYSLRFETAIEDVGYFENDVNFILDKEGLERSYEGQGFIKNLKFISTN
jgi:hypothetical protein